ncbi:DUF3311 domain-containing protein [Actinomadura barringtoniae]|uniref:DUF3311 domain-containing protein n=1 Tax=Actinomadura barringtoniae TaxID=1427535 RepID=A0A939PTZ8_9ACTN|nr:DUF3311 domain-containing protein [Actinomadura barringtoniae]MBO2455014.1 DUF3311 domain-containing protein [Actinomadura barringtoniae]
MNASPPARSSVLHRVVAGVLLAVPFVVYLAVPSYEKEDPKLAGFPFFYWWQLLWVVLTAVCIGGAHLLLRRKNAGGAK